MASLSPEYGKVNYRSSGLGIRFELDEGWAQLDQLMERLPSNLRKGVRDGSINFLRKYHEVIKDAISTNGSSLGQSWELGDKYKEQKERKVGEQPIFRYHGNFADNLRMFVKGYQVSFGIPPGIFNPDTQMDVATYAHIVEFGSLLYDVAITPKPLFGPAFTKVGGNKALKFHIINEITNNLKLGQSFYIR